MKKFIWLLVLTGLLLACPQLQAKPEKDDENPEIESQVAVNVEEINLRPALEIEQAVMEYMLAFEAYQSARKSKDPDTRAKMVQYMKQYREAYARFLSMMREDKLYEPQKPKNPAGRYNKKHESQKGYKRDWKKTAGKELRGKIKKMVEAGATPDEIKKKIRESLPRQEMSVTRPLPPTPIPAGGSGEDGSDGDDNDDDGDDNDGDDEKFDDKGIIGKKGGKTLDQPLPLPTNHHSGKRRH